MVRKVAERTGFKRSRSQYFCLALSAFHLPTALNLFRADVSLGGSLTELESDNAVVILSGRVVCCILYLL